MEEQEEDEEEIGADDEEESEQGEEEPEKEEAKEAKEEEKETEEESSDEETSEISEEDEDTSCEDDGEKEKQEATKEDDEEEAKTSHALVPVTRGTQSTALAIKNSVSHKKEWDNFCRTAKSKMPIQLNEMYATQKQELFNLWMDCDKSWSKCTFEIDRRQQVSNTASRGWTSIQGKELKLKYSEEKWEQIKRKRKEQNLYYPDDDFPDDDDETWTNLSTSLLFPVLVFSIPHQHEPFKT